jgi:hypothetical protein
MSYSNGSGGTTMGFSFTATAECDYCGNLLSSSDETCDHDGQPVEKYVFRRLGEGRDSLVGVKACPKWKWHKLKEQADDEWIAYEFLGTKSRVNGLLTGPIWFSVDELPKLGMSIHAPNSVEEHEVE